MVQGQQQGQQRRQWQNKPTIELDIDSIAFHNMEGEEGKFEVIATATTKRGRVSREEITFSVTGLETPPEFTDPADGKLTYTIPFKSRAPGVYVKVQTTGPYPAKTSKYVHLPWPEKPKGKAQKTKEEKKLDGIKTKIELTKAENELGSITKKEPEPFELIVIPRRVGNRIILYIRVIDEQNRGIKNAKITILDSSQTNLLTFNADEDGEYRYQFDLQPDEEREICITAAGFGDKEFRRTFRGRRLQ